MLQFLNLQLVYFQFQLIFVIQTYVMFHGSHIFLHHIFRNIHKELDRYIFALESIDEKQYQIPLPLVCLA